MHEGPSWRYEGFCILRFNTTRTRQASRTLIMIIATSQINDFKKAGLTEKQSTKLFEDKAKVKQWAQVERVLKSKPAVEKLKKAGFQFRTKAAKVGRSNNVSEKNKSSNASNDGGDENYDLKKKSPNHSTPGGPKKRSPASRLNKLRVISYNILDKDHTKYIPDEFKGVLMELWSQCEILCLQEVTGPTLKDIKKWFKRLGTVVDFEGDIKELKSSAASKRNVTIVKNNTFTKTPKRTLDLANMTRSNIVGKFAYPPAVAYGVLETELNKVKVAIVNVHIVGEDYKRLFTRNWKEVPQSGQNPYCPRSWLRSEDFDADCVIIIGDMNWHQYTYSTKRGTEFKKQIISAAEDAKYLIKKPDAPTVFGKKSDNREPWHKSIADMAFISNLNLKTKLDIDSSINVVRNFPATKLPKYTGEKNDDGSFAEGKKNGFRHISDHRPVKLDVEFYAAL